MGLVYGSPCLYTGFIPYDYPTSFRREWSLASRIAGLKEIYAQRLRDSSREKYPDYRELERKTYLKSRFEEFRDSIISAIRRSEIGLAEKIEAENLVGAMYERFLKGLGFIDDWGNILPSFEVLSEDYEFVTSLERSDRPKEVENFDLRPLESFLDNIVIYSGIDGAFRRGFLSEEIGCPIVENYLMEIN